MKKNKIVLETTGQNVNVNTLTTKELLNLRKKLAKRINQRMVRLEKAGFTGERGGAYAQYQDILNRYFGGAKRIPENMKMLGKGSFKTQVRKMQDLLKQKSSTVQGWREIISKRQKSFKNLYGIDFKDEKEMIDFLSSQEFEQVSRLYDSKQAIRIIASAVKDDKQISDVLKSLEKFRSKTEKTLANQIAKELGFSDEASALKYVYRKE